MGNGDNSVVCRTGKDLNHANTIACCWCELRLIKLVNDGSLEKIIRAGGTKKSGAFAPADDVQELHEHLKRFNFDLELSDSSSGTPTDSSDVTGNKYGRYTTRAVRMFAAHPFNQITAPNGKELDGSKLTKELVAEIQHWCKDGIKSEKDYTKALEKYQVQGYVLRTEAIKTKDKDGKGQKTPAAVDAYGNDLNNTKKQTALHHHVKQFQEDLEKIIDPEAQKPSIYWTCLNAHCGRTYNYKPTGDASDTHGESWHKFPITSARVKLFQMQAQRSLRMVLSSVDPAFPTTGFTIYAGLVDGIINVDTVKEMQLWMKANYKIYSFRPISAPMREKGGSALFQAQLVPAWEMAKKEIERLGGFLPNTCSDAPRSLGTHVTNPGAKDASLHKTGRAIDFDAGVCWNPPKPKTIPPLKKAALPLPPSPAPQPPAQKYVQLKEGVGAGTKWRLFALASGQDDATNLAKSSIYLQKWGNSASKGVLKAWAHDPSHEGGGYEVEVAEGWYIDVTGLLEQYGFVRISPHVAKWEKIPLKDKVREYWHYQNTNGIGATWGDEVLIVGYTLEYLHSEHYGDLIMKSVPS